MPVPTYHASASDICVRITKVVLKSSFAVVAILGNSFGNGEKPTWVPNWLSGDLWQRKRRAEYLLLPRDRRATSICWRERWYSGKYFPNWKAHGNSIQHYSIKGRVLRTRGRLIGTIHTLSSTFEEEASLPLFTPYGPSTIVPARRSSHRHLFKALFYLLTFTSAGHWCGWCCSMSNVQCCSIADVQIMNFRLLFSRFKRTGLQRLAPSVLAWLELNRKLDVFGRNLERRISVPKGVRDCFRYMVPTLTSNTLWLLLFRPLSPPCIPC